MNSYTFMLKVDGKEIPIADRLISLKVSDSIDNETDILSIVLEGSQELGVSKDSEVIVGLGIKEKSMYDLGSFLLHERRIKPERLTLNFRSVSPINYKRKYERVWDNKPLIEIIDEISSNSGLELLLDGELRDIKLSLNGSYSDRAVLTYILERTGAILKIRKNKMIVSLKENYESLLDGQLKIFLVEEAKDWSYTEGIALNYTGVKTWVYDTERKDRIPIVIDDQTNPLEILPISQNIESETIRARNLLQETNKKKSRLQIEIYPDSLMNTTEIIAGSKIIINKLEGISGKWQVRRLEHQITPKGLTTKLDCELI